MWIIPASSDGETVAVEKRAAEPSKPFVGSMFLFLIPYQTKLSLIIVDMWIIPASADGETATVEKRAAEPSKPFVGSMSTLSRSLPAST
jgi:hypothetical protein